MEKKLVATILAVSMLFGNSLWQIDAFANLNNVANGIEEMHETQEVEETKETQELEKLEKMEESQVFDDLEIEVPSNNDVNLSTDLKNENNNESKVLSTSDDAGDENIYIEELESEIVSEDETITESDEKSENETISESIGDIEELTINESDIVESDFGSNKLATESEINKEDVSGEIEIETIEETNDKKVLLGVSNDYYLNSDWVPPNTSQDSENPEVSVREWITKITFQKGGAEPVGTKTDIPNSNGLSYYIDGTELVVYAIDANKEIFFGGPAIFKEFSLLREIEGLDLVNTSTLTNMGNMFSNTALRELDLSNFDTSNVTNMGEMFAYSGIRRLDLSNFDTSKVTSMHRMFCECRSLEEIDLSGFETAKVTDMWGMFYECNSLEELDLSQFETANVINMGSMFASCNSLTTIYVSNNFTLNENLYDGNGAGGGGGSGGGGSSGDEGDGGGSSGDEGDGGGSADDKYMFEECYSLVGGNGTVYSRGHLGKEYAHVDEEGNPGYFTLKDLCTVTFNMKGHGSQIKNQKIESGSLITKPTDPTATGYTFEGWYKDSNLTEPWDFDNDVVNSSITIYAKWVKKQSSNGSNANNYAGSGGSGGGGGGGGEKKMEQNIIPSVFYNAEPKPAIVPTYDFNSVSWSSDVNTGKYKLTVNDNGQYKQVMNGFVTINVVESKLINGINVPILSQYTYYFDNVGNMVTGWVKTLDNKTYFFETEKTVNEGRMVTGWKKIQNDWYFFNEDGSMLTGWLNSTDNKVYYLEDEKTENEGKMITGWRLIQNEKYYFNLDGSLLIVGLTTNE